MVAASMAVRPAAAASAVVRPARSEDGGEIEAVQRLSLGTLGREFYDRRQLAAMLRYLTLLEDHLLRDRTYYVVEIDGAIAGCGGWSSRLPSYEASGALPADAAAHAKVRAMYVHPRFAGCGFGRKLLDTIETAMLRVGHARAYLDATLSGVPFYRRCGYVFCARTQFEFPNGVRAPIVRMRKRLGQGARP